MSTWIDSFVAHYGVIAVFAGTALQGLGVAITGGVMAHRDLLSFWPVALAAGAGGFLSDIVIFAIGRRYRDAHWIQRVLEYQKVAKLVEKLSRNTVMFALVFKFIPGMRTAGPLSLAALGMPPAAYAFYTGISAFLWGITSTMLGFYLGHAVEMTFGRLHKTEHALIAPLIVAALLSGGVFLWRRRRSDA